MNGLSVHDNSHQTTRTNNQLPRLFSRSLAPASSNFHYQSLNIFKAKSLDGNITIDGSDLCRSSLTTLGMKETCERRHIRRFYRSKALHLLNFRSTDNMLITETTIHGAAEQSAF